MISSLIITIAYALGGVLAFLWVRRYVGKIAVPRWEEKTGLIASIFVLGAVTAVLAMPQPLTLGRLLGALLFGIIINYSIADEFAELRKCPREASDLSG